MSPQYPHHPDDQPLPHPQPPLAIAPQELPVCHTGDTGSIDHAARQAWHPLSAIQRSLWFQYRLYPELQGCYNIAFVARLTPLIAPARLQAALDQVAARHGALRTRFGLVDGQPRQQAQPSATVPLTVVPVDSLDDEALDPAVHRDRARPFDLALAPLVRASLYVRQGWQGRPMAAQDGVLLLALDHLVCDAWSLWQLLDELSALLLADGHGLDATAVPAPPTDGEANAGLPPVGPPFFQHVQQQRDWLDSAAGQRQLAHWRRELADPPAELALPLDRPGTPPGAPPGTQPGPAGPRRTWAQDLPDALTARLRALAARQGSSMFTVLLAGFVLLLNRLSGQRQLAVGSPMPARGAEWAHTVGSFTNPVVLRADIDDGLTVSQLLQQLQSRAWRALKHQHYPLAELVERLRPARAESGQPWYRVLFVAQKARAAERTLGLLAHAKSIGQVPWAGVQLSAFGQPQNNGGSGMDLLMEVAEIGDSLMTGLDYDTDRFSEPTIQRWMANWQTLLQAMTEGDEQPVHTLALLPDAERHQVLVGWNQTTQALPLARCVHELVEAQALRAPDALAVVDGADQLSYAELNSRANQLAHYLRDLGVRPDDRVALCAPRGAAMLVALLAIWKSGGAYVPLDPAYPADRLAHMLADSQCPVVLTLGTQDRVRAHLPAGAVLVDLAEQAGHWQQRDGSDLPVSSLGLNARHLAYVIYTSGSTGLPKGVMVEHRSLVNYALDARGWFGLGPRDLVLQQNALNFDLSIEEIVPALLAGAALAPSGEIFGLQEELKPSVVHLTAAHWHTLVGEWAQAPERALAQLDGVRLVNVTGDALSPHKVQQWDQLRPPSTVLINTYGPTEITVSCSAAYVRHDPQAQRVSIGTPFANTRLYLLDSHGQPVPIGVVGELYIGGEGVARGYLNRPELTAQRFLPDPFSQDPGARMYRTGDLARWRPDGQVEFVGRNDFQVKVRGFRIELGEVETRLSGCPGVTEVVVLARGEHAGDKQLVAYITGEVDEAALRAHAQQALPPYMWPAAYVRLAQMPKTPGGKLDRQALPVPPGLGQGAGPDGTDPGGATAFEPPQGETEHAMAQLWCELLGCAQVGRHDNFFALGGHSLLAVQLVERLRRLGLTVQVRALFGNSPTVAGLARLADDARAGAAAGAPDAADEVPPNRIPPGATRITPDMLPLVDLTQDQIDAIAAQVDGGVANIQDIYPLTHAQEGILFHHQLQPEHDAYVETCLLACHSPQDLLAIAEALQAVVDRHDILRSQVQWAGLDQPVQLVQRQARLSHQRLSLDPADGDIGVQLRALADNGALRIDLARPPLLRLCSAHDAARGRWLMLLAAHHLIVDNVAQAVLLDEVRQIADARTRGHDAGLPPGRPYRDFVHRARLRQDTAADAAFFRGMLADIDAPTRAFGLADTHGDGRGQQEARCRLPRPLSVQLRQQARRCRVSIASLTHLAWALVLAHASGQPRVVFGTVLMGRSHAGEQADRLIGMFINTLPLRVDVAGQSTEAALQALHQRLAGLMQHEHASLGQASRCSAVPGDVPLFNTLFNHRFGDIRQDDRTADGSLRFELLHDQERSNYPLSVDVDDLGEDLALQVQAHPSVSAQQVCEHLQTALAALADALHDAPQTPLQDLQTLPESQRGLDRPALPVPAGPAGGGADDGTPAADGQRIEPAFEPPQGDTEQAIAQLWCQLLGCARVGRHDNFFALGGHSLLAVQLVERLRRRGLAVPVRALFGPAPTLAGLARVADEAQAAAAARAAANEAAPNAQDEVPPNRIPDGATRITPGMLSLVELGQDRIDAIAALVDGGAANIQDIYPLTHEQAEMLGLHRRHAGHDPWGDTSLLACRSAEQLDRFIQALQAVVNRHDVLRTRFVWADLDQPLQVVQRTARLRVRALDHDPRGQHGHADPARRLLALAADGVLRVELDQAPVIQLYTLADPARQRWLLLLLGHHIVLDHEAEGVVLAEVGQWLDGQGAALDTPVPFRDFVARARGRVDAAASQAFFSRMLADIDQPTLAFGLADVHGNGQYQGEAQVLLPRALSHGLRQLARQQRVSVASLMHLAWARVLASLTGLPRVVFGTILFGRGIGGQQVDRQVGMFTHTLPIRVDLDGPSLADSLQQVHARLAGLLDHETAPLRLAQASSGVPAGQPLFNTLFNFRYGDARGGLQRGDAPFELLAARERSNYPLTLDVDDLGDDLGLVVQAHPSIDVDRVADQVLAALQALADELAVAGRPAGAWA